MNADDPRTWHPEMAGPPDKEVTARFVAMMLGYQLVDTPTPGSRLDRFMRVCDAHEAGRITKDELDRSARALMREAIAEAEAEERLLDESGDEPKSV